MKQPLPPLSSAQRPPSQTPVSTQLLELLNISARQHRASIVLAAGALLAGFGITAVAVAPLLPGQEPPPLRTVVQSVPLTGLDAQLEALANQNFTLTRSEVTRGGDTAYSLLARLGVRDTGVLGFLMADGAARSIFSGRSGKMVSVRTQVDGSLQDLVVRFPTEDSELAKSHFSRVTVQREAGRWKAVTQLVPYGAEARLAGGTIRSSLFAATDDAGLPDALAVQMADIFSSDIDMHRQLRKGDTFSVVYESLTADGQPVPWNDGVGRVLAAEFVNAGRAHHALWFAQDNGRGSYFGIDGASRRNAFLASPMAFSRVTSGFGMRMHPVLQTLRAHAGVDYAAPTGTLVRSVGDGVVITAGRQSGYGNVVEVRHGGERSTLYAHLSEINVRVGQRIEQGQKVGEVGSTGLATGPHLHFEFRVKGVHQDPLLVAKAVEATTLDREARQRFAQLSQLLQAKLDLAETLTGSNRQKAE